MGGRKDEEEFLAEDATDDPSLEDGLNVSTYRDLAFLLNVPIFLDCGNCILLSEPLLLPPAAPPNDEGGTGVVILEFGVD